jgi:hypothetical protein
MDTVWLPPNAFTVAPATSTFDPPTEVHPQSTVFRAAKAALSEIIF